jgi:hypothetical protein
MDIEWIIVADSAQVINNKLFVMGGGWEILTVNSGFPVRHRASIAVSFRVPWGETNEPHAIEIEVQNEDGESLAKVEGLVEVGRPPGLRGQDQRTQLAVDLDLELAHAGAFVVIGRLDGEDKKRVGFTVVEGTLLQQRGGPGA